MYVQLHLNLPKHEWETSWNFYMTMPDSSIFHQANSVLTPSVSTRCVLLIETSVSSDGHSQWRRESKGRDLRNAKSEDVKGLCISSQLTLFLLNRSGCSSRSWMIFCLSEKSYPSPCCQGTRCLYFISARRVPESTSHTLAWCFLLCRETTCFEWTTHANSMNGFNGIYLDSPSYHFHVSWCFYVLMLVSLMSWFKMFFMFSYVFPSRLLSLSPLHPPRRRHCGALSDCSTTSRQQGTDGMCQGHRQDGICQLEFLPFTAWHQHRAMRCPIDWRVDVDSIVIAYKYNISIYI